MNREIYKKLVQWSTSKYRKPLVLQGARQVGKTHALKWLGLNHYKNLIHLNFERDPLLSSLFQETLDPKILVTKISGYLGQNISPDGESLLVFDEIQECNEALNSLKYFCEDAPQYHVAAAGSLLGVKLSKGRSFPVGKVDFLNISPLTFLEFLEANHCKSLKILLEEKHDLRALSEAFHQKLLTQLTHYFVVGGMPEVVSAFTEDRTFKRIRSLQENILKAYQVDFAKHAPTSDIRKLSLIWDSIPRHLARENKRFLFSAVRSGARARDFENALQWLRDAGLIHYCNRLSKIAMPLNAYASPEIFKIYALDIGLLGAMANLSIEVLLGGSRIFQEFHGAFIENFVAQEITSRGICLYYWESEGKAEIDFICQASSGLFPLEAKAGINVKSKSMRVFQESHPEIAKICRANLLNFQKAEQLENYPLYGLSVLFGST